MDQFFTDSSFLLTYNLLNTSIKILFITRRRNRRNDFFINKHVPVSLFLICAIRQSSIAILVKSILLSSYLTNPDVRVGRLVCAFGTIVELDIRFSKKSGNFRGNPNMFKKLVRQWPIQEWVMLFCSDELSAILSGPEGPAI